MNVIFNNVVSYWGPATRSLAASRQLAHTLAQTLGLLAAAILWSRPASAGNNGYFVTYNSQVERGETELMFMNDITSPSQARRDDGLGTYLSHMVELEYGITQQFATEFMVEWFEDLETAKRSFGGFRWESRYRLFGHAVPFNPMLYIEYEDLDPSTRFKMEVSGWVRPPYVQRAEPSDRERILESRLILSQDVGAANLAVNWVSETELATGTTAFGYAAAVMWMQNHSEVLHEYACTMHPEVHQPSPGKCPICGMDLVAKDDNGHTGGAGIGLEMYGALGDTKAFRMIRSRQEHYLGPILMYHLSDHWMMHTQLAIGLTSASDNLVRLNFGYEF